MTLVKSLIEQYMGGLLVQSGTAYGNVAGKLKASNIRARFSKIVPSTR
jgi:hypothetical protein